MNRFGFCKQEGPVFRIRDLNSPWRSVLHLGQRQMVGKSYQWEDDPETVREFPESSLSPVHLIFLPRSGCTTPRGLRGRGSQGNTG